MYANLISDPIFDPVLDQCLNTPEVKEMVNIPLDLPTTYLHCNF